MQHKEQQEEDNSMMPRHPAGAFGMQGSVGRGHDEAKAQTRLYVSVLKLSRVCGMN